MAESNWTVATDSLDAASVDRGVTNGIARPNGGGNFIYGFNSLVLAEGAVALFANQASFAPMAKGCSIRGAIQRGVSGGPTGFAPFLFAGLQGSSVNDSGYLLGLQDDDPHHIVLRKGSPAGGLPAGNILSNGNGILLRSTATYSPGTWLHLRLDVIVNANGDVILQCFANDLTAHAVTSPTWVAIPGMTQFIDDALEVNSGSAPFTSGRAGFGMFSEDVTRRGFFDHLEVLRQL